MKLLDRILVATDFGPAAEDAVRMASWSACRFESKVDLLHVRPSESTAGASSELDQAVSARLDAIAEHMVEQGVRQVESVVLDGTEFDVIVRYAEQQSVNVIVVGAGEKTPGSPHVFLGTTAARLRRWASQPVWIVKPGEAPPIRRIFCPVDLALDSARAMRTAIHFARTFGAELTIMTAVPPSQGDSGELRGEYADTPPESREPRLPELDSFLAKFDFHNVRSAKLIRQGKPRYEVARAAREIRADLIVMGSAGRTGLPRMLVGGVARRVAQELPCSIVTVRSQELIRLSDGREVPSLDAEFCSSHPSGRSCDRYQYGLKMLEQGLGEEAAQHFQTCVVEYSLCANAWRRLAEANRRVDRPEDAERCEKNAAEALRRQENQRVDEDVRGRHILYRRIFDI